MAESTESTESTESKPVVPISLPPVGWSDPAPQWPVPFWASLRQDIIAHIPPERRNRSRLSWGLITAWIALKSPGFKVVFCYRFNHMLRHYLGLPGKLFGGVVNWLLHRFYFCSISPSARIFGGLILPHPQGIILGAGVVVGPWTWIYQNVTMGGSHGREGEPRLGSDCRILTGAVLSGPIVLGDEVVVCPNSFVQRSVPHQSLAVGVPASIFPLFGKSKGGKAP